WSSAKSMRILRYIASFPEGDFGPDPDTLSRPRIYGHGAAGDTRSRAHAGEADPVGRRRQSHASPIIANGQAQDVFAVCEFDPNLSRIRKTRHVGQRFLCDAEQLSLDGVIQTAGERRRIERRDSGSFAEVIGQP